MQLPDVTIGEIYGLLGEKDVRIFQLEKIAKSIEAEKALEKESPKKDPFKKG